jgi:hypothetical protein
MTEEDVQLVCRQTTYTEDEARERLKETGNDPVEVIRTFLNPQPKKSAPTAANPHQIIFQEIGKIMTERGEKKLN